MATRRCVRKHSAQLNASHYGEEGEEKHLDGSRGQGEGPDGKPKRGP